LAEKVKERNYLEDLRCMWEDNIEKYVKELKWENK
jgi:hypothetical protein